MLCKDHGLHHAHMEPKEDLPCDTSSVAQGQAPCWLPQDPSLIAVLVNLPQTFTKLHQEELLDPEAPRLMQAMHPRTIGPLMYSIANR